MKYKSMISRKLIIVGILVIGLCTFLFLPAIGITDIKDRLNIAILSVTFLALLWYAWETYHMQQAIVHQLDVAVSPYLLLVRIDPETAEERDKFELKNLGNGTALNISIGDIELCSNPLIILKFPNIPYLQPNEKSIIQAQNYQDNELITPGFSVVLANKYSDNNYEVNLRYFDVLNRLITQKLTLGKSGLIFVKQNKKD